MSEIIDGHLSVLLAMDHLSRDLSPSGPDRPGLPEGLRKRRLDRLRLQLLGGGPDSQEGSLGSFEPEVGPPTNERLEVRER